MNLELVRLATIYLKPPPSGWRGWTMTIGDVTIQTHGAWDVDGSLKLLVSASIRLESIPELSDAYVVVPEVARRAAESGLEIAANLIAVAEECHRSVRSPLPHVALVPRDDAAVAWLANAKGLAADLVQVSSMHFPIDIVPMLPDLMDRLDGVALLAEALGHEHATGRLHEFLRVFERAFGVSSTDLVKPMTAFLQGNPSRFDAAEIRRWVVEIRHSATHADRRPSFVLESDIRPVIMRVADAAYDVLFNKTVWRSASTARRELWKPVAGTLPDGAWIVQGTSGGALQTSMLDAFGSYPIDGSSCLQRSQFPNWWCPTETGRDGSTAVKTRAMTVTVVPRHP